MLVDADAATSPQLRQLPDIDVTVDSTTSEMERRMADQEKKMEAIEKMMEASARSVFAQLTEAPSNLHQATAFYASVDEPEDTLTRACLLLSSVTLVLGQVAVAVAVFQGTNMPSCKTSDQCYQKGTVCGLDIGRCGYCGLAVQGLVHPVETDESCLTTHSIDACLTMSTADASREFTYPPAAGTSVRRQIDSRYMFQRIDRYSNIETYNLTALAEVCAVPSLSWKVMEGRDTQEGVIEFCEVCIRNDGTVDPLTRDSLNAANVDIMGGLDKSALIFAAFVVAFTVVSELKDISLCSLQIKHAGEDMSTAWRLTLTFLGGIRRWAFLPGLVFAIPSLVLFKGGDALGICFNTIAILFLSEIGEPSRHCCLRACLLVAELRTLQLSAACLD